MFCNVVTVQLQCVAHLENAAENCLVFSYSPWPMSSIHHKCVLETKRSSASIAVASILEVPNFEIKIG